MNSKRICVVLTNLNKGSKYILFLRLPSQVGKAIDIFDYRLSSHMHSIIKVNDGIYQFYPAWGSLCTKGKRVYRTDFKNLYFFQRDDPDFKDDLRNLIKTKRTSKEEMDSENIE